MLLDSNFPMNCTMKGGITALIIASEDPIYFKLCIKMLSAGANINMISNTGDSALSQAVKGSNKKLTQLLIEHQAAIFYEKGKHRDRSPFFQAIEQQSQWAIELYCDNSTDMN